MDDIRQQAIALMSLMLPRVNQSVAQADGDIVAVNKDTRTIIYLRAHQRVASKGVALEALKG